MLSIALKQLGRRKKKQLKQAGRRRKIWLLGLGAYPMTERIITDTTKKTHPEEDTAGLAS